MKPPKYVLRDESPEELSGLPVPLQVERDQAYQLLPTTPLNKDDAVAYGSLMFALGRRQVSMEVRGWLKEVNAE